MHWVVLEERRVDSCTCTLLSSEDCAPGEVATDIEIEIEGDEEVADCKAGTVRIIYVVPECPAAGGESALQVVSLYGKDYGSMPTNIEKLNGIECLSGRRIRMDVQVPRVFA